jgi:hypothetical protein
MALIARAGGADVILRLLSWAADHALSLESLRERIKALADIRLP